MNLNLKWQIVVLTQSQGQELCSWSYPQPYDIYNWPKWEIMLRDDSEFADPVIRTQQYAAIVDEHEHLCGFAQFFPIVGVTRLGVGLRPDLCGAGKGLGQHLIKLLVDEAKRRAPQHEIDLEVLVWNERAIRTYERAGFTITDTYERSTPTGTALFHCMVYNVAKND
ncbi:GNAT family N-acetyltransferase [Paenibacillus sp. SYP-B3998]|uniref:GNAT family N-acetyltransferase n=1 Tax=Paenibacillus sp. SYP-B3998 TaxID=2678564 RepID=A0A6G3ZZI7_9BACL|nr:GNAT family N-acetyltransferase [Paenibacillus sp. SYP-B3998]NEW07552.1 GNAT family N-acetyltransferase [Paenibacillus sp. SYP-B3998]